jgi:hypothetical protein
LERIAPKIREVEFGHGAKADTLGETLFARYVVPCKLGEFQGKKLPEQAWQQLLALALGRTPLDRKLGREFLGQHFDLPVNGLYVYSRARGLSSNDEIWSYSNVSGFWHEHQGHADECAVKRVIIETSMGSQILPPVGKKCRIYSARCEAEVLRPLVDIYDLWPTIGSPVFIHKHAIPEVEWAH